MYKWWTVVMEVPGDTAVKIKYYCPDSILGKIIHICIATGTPKWDCAYWQNLSTGRNKHMIKQSQYHGNRCLPSLCTRASAAFILKTTCRIILVSKLVGSGYSFINYKGIKRSIEKNQHRISHTSLIVLLLYSTRTCVPDAAIKGTGK